jgi:hypothetical protein
MEKRRVLEGYVAQKKKIFTEYRGELQKSFSFGN